MGLIKFALKYRITFYVMAVLIMLSGGGAAVVMPKDVLPEVNIPVVTVLWTYIGLPATQMQNQVTSYSELALSNNVVGIRDMESTTLQGITVTKIYFQPGTDISVALTQVTSATNAIRALLPAGIQPPIVLRFNASSVPVIQVAATSAVESQAEVYNYMRFRLRPALQTAPGTTIPPPYGGTAEQVMIDLDPHAMQAYGLTPMQVLNQVNAQSLTLPSGYAKMGQTQFIVKLNALPDVLDTLNTIPLKVVNGSPILLRDVGWARAGGPPQQNMVHVDGANGLLLPVLKNGPISTTSIIDDIKSRIPGIKAAAPKDIKILTLFDQSTFVTEAIGDVAQEGLIAAGLTGLMILLFLGSWRATLVVLVSIPLAVLTSLAVLYAIGETMNVMTLGGLALAVGILVDDATVAIENTYRVLEEGKGFRESVVEGAATIAKPTLISTLSICSAFVSVLFMVGAPKYIFTPQALAVVFAMLASYLLSRTLVPILIDVLVGPEHARKQEGEQRNGEPGRRPGRLRSFFSRFHQGFEKRFERFHQGYLGLLHAVLTRRLLTGAVVGAVVIVAACLFPFLGRDYFPAIQSGQLTLHVRAKPGLRIEEAAKVFQRVEDTIREQAGPGNVTSIVDNIGLPSVTYNLAFNDGTFVAYNDGQVLVTLKPGINGLKLTKALRRVLPDRFPDTVFYFQPADIITQILDFGVPAQIDVQVHGRHMEEDLQAGKRLENRLRQLPGLVDVHLQQITDAPELFTEVDRQRALELGLTEQEIVDQVNISLSGSFQVAPNFWTDPKTGIPWQLTVQTPEYKIDTFDAVANTPIYTSNNGQNAPQPITLLRNVASFHRTAEPSVLTHINTQPTFDVYAAVQDTDLGSAEAAINWVVAEEQKHLKPGDTIQVRGQIESMESAFSHIEVGLVVAVIAVYLLMVLNYQDWGDPLVVLCALPLVFCGIVFSLFITHTTFSIASLMGAIMSVGVASANSILLVTFAREHRERTGASALEGALAAGEARLRPVLMTAGAMVVGLVPMALDLGQGGEQNAALARAVIGGIIVGTCSTLLFVPFLYTLLRHKPVRAPENYL
ncbi:efflux RND transporter permease subunit [Rhizosaccharibacter radicis]|uniref:Efflux RND transporter permease subunit n=1 Tax=Rhizosaccharibacter radicis TaxID=2782605 RepID=A0ABT1W1S3_9PROT|nr:efflux RND transporter permease subunit [Acetobacteraceae bacterium KSS12]